MNAAIYKSSPLLVFRNFALILIVPVLLFAVLSTTSDAHEYMTITFSILIFGTALATYFAFHRNNIAIEVTANALKFSRHGTEFLNIDRETHEFASCIIHGRTGASRYLRVIPKNGGKYKDYECHNFDKKTFEEFITAVSASSSEQQAKTEYYKEPITFAINKSFMLEKYKKHKFISFGVVSVALLYLSVVALLPSIDVSQKTYMLIVLFPIIASIFSILKTVQFSKVKNQTPEKITIFKDKLAVDNEDFYFSYLTQIKMTPPLHEKDIYTWDAQLPWQNLFRKMIVTERNISREFILDILPIKGNSRPQSAFLEYSNLFDELEELFVNNENKFIVELE